MSDTENWTAALAAVENLVASKLHKHNEDPDVKDVAASAVHMFLAYTNGEKDPIENLALLFQCAHFEIKMWCYNQSKTPAVPDTVVSTIEEPLWIAPDLNIFMMEIRDMLEAHVTDSKDRVILDLYFKGFTQDTIGHVLGVSHSTISRKLTRIHECLRKEMFGR